MSPTIGPQRAVLGAATTPGPGRATVHWRAVSKDDGNVVADWLILFSAFVLTVSLFLPWSSLSSAYVAVADRLHTLQGVATDPDAWQVYSAADVLLFVLAVMLVYTALAGPRAGRVVALVATVLALAFTIHAEAVPPTNGAPSAFRPGLGVGSTVTPDPSSGAGEAAAIIALLVALGGLGLSLVTD